MHYAALLIVAAIFAAALVRARIRRARRLRPAATPRWGTPGDRLEEVIRLAQNDGRWDDPKRRGHAVRAAEKWQRQLDARDRDRRAR